MQVFVALELLRGRWSEGSPSRAVWKRRSSALRSSTSRWRRRIRSTTATAAWRASMMDAELAASSEERMIIPTVYRGDYPTALRALATQRPARAVDRDAGTRAALDRRGRLELGGDGVPGTGARQCSSHP